MASHAAPNPNNSSNSDGSNEGSKDDEPPSKRRRVALACNACRIRKSRCNGDRPKCSNCSNLGFDCEYQPTESSTNVIVKKEYVSDLEARLKTVEETLQKHNDLITSHFPTLSTNPEQPHRSPHGGRQSLVLEAVSQDNIELDAAVMQDLPAVEMTDGMAMTLVDEIEPLFFGPSSLIAFNRHIMGAMATRNITQPKRFKAQKQFGLESGIHEFSRPASPTKSDGLQPSDSAVFELPPEAALEQLLHSYFRTTGLLFPFIHEPSFMDTYHRFKASNFSRVRRTWLGLLNILLAMGVTMNPMTSLNAASREEESDLFYQRALSLCGRSSITGTSLEVVQYLLLASQYLQSTQKSNQTWTLHGLAVKGAFALGLHSHQAPERFSSLESEIRKRTWFGCVLLDRVLSMTFGRPPNIPEDYVRLPLAQDWPCPELSNFARPELQASSMTFFNASITLHGCIGMAIARLYGQNLGYDAILSEAELTPRLSGLEQELSRWRSSLPSTLKIVSSSALPTPSSNGYEQVERFRTMLTLRYHNLNILVHRPLLCSSLDNLTEKLLRVRPDPWNRIEKNSIDACVGSAEETIDIVHGILTDPTLGAAILGAWWFTLYYLFKASLVIFSKFLIESSALHHVYNGSQQAVQDMEHLKRAVDAFRLLDRENRIIERCTEYVGYLLKVIEQQQSGITTCTPRGNDSCGNVPLPNLNDFLRDDLELAQFFASGIFDLQGSGDGTI